VCATVTAKSVSCSAFSRMGNQSCNSSTIAAKWSVSLQGRKSEFCLPCVPLFGPLPQEAICKQIVAPHSGLNYRYQALSLIDPLRPPGPETTTKILSH